MLTRPMPKRPLILEWERAHVLQKLGFRLNVSRWD